MTSFQKLIRIHGRQDVLASKMKAAQCTVSQMASGTIAINVEWYPLLAKLSKGELTEVDFMEDEIDRLRKLKKLRN